MIENIQLQLLEKDQPPFELLRLADPSIDQIKGYIFQSEVYGAFLNNIIIGVYVLYNENAEVVEVKNIAVAEAFQGQGVGQFLLQDAFKKTKAKGYKEIRIGTGNSSIKQLYLYQKMGFEMTTIKKNFFTTHYGEPIYENGIICKHMVMLTKYLD